VSTLLVNVLGSLSVAIGGQFAVRGHGSQPIHSFLVAGIFGGFTASSASQLPSVCPCFRGVLDSGRAEPARLTTLDSSC
jgi:fluoride ion exporter CrcB/FEX